MSGLRRLGCLCHTPTWDQVQYQTTMSLAPGYHTHMIVALCWYTTHPMLTPPLILKRTVYNLLILVNLVVKTKWHWWRQFNLVNLVVETKGNLGTLELWNFGTLELWNFETLELWNYSAWELWNFGTLELWNLWSLELWNFGTWELGNLGTWKLGK